MQTSTVLKAAAVLLIVGASAYALYIYGPTLSAIGWKMGADDPVQAFYPVPGGLFLAGSGNVSYVNQTGLVLWSRPVPGTGLSALGEDGRLYVAARGQGLSSYGLDGNVSYVGAFNLTSPPLADRNGTLYLLDGVRLAAVSHGAEVWSDPYVIVYPVLDGADNLYYLDRMPSYPADAYLICRSPVGELRWVMLFDRYFNDTRLLPAEDGVCVLSPGEAEVQRFSGTGNMSWRYYKPYMGPYQQAGNGSPYLFLIYPQGTVHVLSPDGGQIDKYQLQNYAAGLTALPAASNGTLVTLGQDLWPDSAIVYATGLSDAILWKAQINCSGPCRAFAGDRTVCVTADLQRKGRTVSVLYIFEAGQLRHAVYADEGQAWDQVSIAGNAVYARTSGGLLYSLKGD